MKGRRVPIPHGSVRVAHARAPMSVTGTREELARMVVAETTRKPTPKAQDTIPAFLQGWSGWRKA